MDYPRPGVGGNWPIANCKVGNANCEMPARTILHFAMPVLQFAIVRVG
jgi:hypothetical protein